MVKIDEILNWDNTSALGLWKIYPVFFKDFAGLYKASLGLTTSPVLYKTAPLTDTFSSTLCWHPQEK